MLATLLKALQAIGAILKIVPAIVEAITKFMAARRARKLEDHIQEGQDIERRLEEATTNEERANLAEELARHISGNKS